RSASFATVRDVDFVGSSIRSPAKRNLYHQNFPLRYVAIRDSCPVGERAGVGAQLKVQAKAKLDQISEGPAPREGVIQDMRLEVWSWFTMEATTELGCYGLASVLKVSDDKIDYNRANFVSFCCFQLL
ncbi:MAG: hypothetical protein WB408_00490, partial [Terracidiphilus sp.]